MNDRASIGRAVREHRERLGLRQDELALRAGCSTRFVHMLEAGKPSVRLDKVVLVLESLGLVLRVEQGPGDVASHGRPEADRPEGSDDMSID